MVHLVSYFLRLGAIGFGGPVALTGYMQRDLVDRRGWISGSEYKDGLALAQLAPGPLAAQLAFYIGFVHYGVLGATLVGFAFVLPSFLMVVAAGWAYVHFEGLSWIQDVFYGVGAAMIGIIANSAFTGAVVVLGRRSVIDLTTLAIAVAVLLLLLRYGRKAPEPLLVLAAAAFGLAVRL